MDMGRIESYVVWQPLQKYSYTGIDGSDMCWARGGVGDYGSGPGQARYMIPFSWRDSISAAERPNSPTSTSWLCWPRVGAGPKTSS